MKYFVYILECADKTLYTGIASDVERRLIEHNDSKKGARYTKARRPVALKYVEEWKNRSLASQRETQIKKMNREEKKALIDNNG